MRIFASRRPPCPRAWTNPVRSHTKIGMPNILFEKKYTQQKQAIFVNSFYDVWSQFSSMSFWDVERTFIELWTLFPDRWSTNASLTFYRHMFSLIRYLLVRLLGIHRYVALGRKRRIALLLISVGKILTLKSLPYAFAVCLSFYLCHSILHNFNCLRIVKTCLLKLGR